MTRSVKSDALSPAPRRLPAGLRIGFWVYFVVGLAIVGRRVLALRKMGSSGSVPPDLAQLDTWFRMHATLTYAHILTALVFLMVLPLVFWRRTKNSFAVHAGFYGLGTAVVLTAYAMSAYSLGGWVERSAVLVFNTLFASSLGLSLRAWRADDAANERRWTFRATATVFGIATTRPVMGVFFATSRLTHWTRNSSSARPSGSALPSMWRSWKRGSTAVQPPTNGAPDEIFCNHHA